MDRPARRLMLKAAAAAACLTPFGCAPASGRAELRVASQKGATRALMTASGALAGAPYSIRWSEFAAASPLLEALGAGAVDIGGVGDAPFLYAFAAGSRIKAVFAYRSASSGASVGVVVPKGSSLRGPKDLAGRRVATTKGSVGHYLVLRLLESVGLPLDSAHLVFLSPGDCKAALDRASVDAWSTWSPYLGLALLHAQCRLLADGRGLFPGYSFMAATDLAIAGKRDLLDDFLRRLDAAYLWSHAHPADWAKALSKDTGIPLDVAADAITRQNLAPAPITPQVVEAERATLDLFRRAGAAQAVGSVDAAFDPAFNAAVRTGG